MVPAYNADALLEVTLRSVLNQDPGPDCMEIVVVDDHSPGGRAEEIVRRLAPGRIGYRRGERNLGLAGNWNRCVGLSRGRWVHLLHQDDVVLPGFYDRLGRADGHPDVGAAFCQHAFIDSDGHWEAISGLEARVAGPLDRWLARISDYQRIQCPSIVVRREVYERLGGFVGELIYGLDWEMWVRIAARYDVWYEPTVLACWRRHPGSETARLQEAGKVVADSVRAVALARAHLPEGLRGRAGEGLVRQVRAEVQGLVRIRLEAGDYRGALAGLGTAFGRDPALWLGRDGRGYLKWVAKVWARGPWHRGSGPARAPGGNAP